MLKKFSPYKVNFVFNSLTIITSTCIKLQLYCYGLIWRNKLCAKMIESVAVVVSEFTAYYDYFWSTLKFTVDVCVCTFKIQDTCTKDTKIQKDLDSHITVDGWYPWMIQWRAYSFSTLFFRCRHWITKVPHL